MGRGAEYSFVRYLLTELGRDARYVLELGCGTAVYRPLFLSKHYVATDIPNSWYQSKGDVDVFASGNHLPFAPESFDLIFSQAALDYMPDTREVLKESYRVLRPGGRFLVITYRKSVLERIHRDCADRGIRHCGIYTPRELVRWLEGAAFNALEVPRPSVYDGSAARAWIKATLASIPPFGTVMRMISNWRIVLGTKSGSVAH
ncbi:MAG TPA: methyltransferase domain-containing protein [Bryobacteraceae bacterium]|nr:methyltransferase domain-containing protein [Bryobacteraceae bacterium]